MTEGRGAMARERARLLERVAAGPVRVADVARRVATTEQRSAGGRWTARENVAHVVLVERLVFQARLDQLAAGERPTWAWTEPSTSDEPDVATLDIALATLAAARAGTLARVASLDEAGWARAGHHATYGRLDVAGILGTIVEHDDHHVADIAALGGPTERP